MGDRDLPGIIMGFCGKSRQAASPDDPQEICTEQDFPKGPRRNAEAPKDSPRDFVFKTRGWVPGTKN